METQKKPLSAWHYVLGLVILLSLGWVANSSLVQPPTQAAAPANAVTLHAESWNDGKVLVWHDLDESSDRYTSVPDGTRCRKLDTKRHQVGSGETAMHYRYLDCNGVIGYVLWRQAR